MYQCYFHNLNGLFDVSGIKKLTLIENLRKTFENPSTNNVAKNCSELVRANIQV